MVIRIGEMLHPAWTRTAMAFGGTTATIADKLQPAMNRTAAVLDGATNLVGAFLIPTSVVAFVLAIWRLGADLGFTGDFIITAGLFSHWQIWMMLALLLKLTGSLINRAGESKAEAEETQPD